MLKLPKNILQIANLAALETHFTATEDFLISNHHVRVSKWALDDALGAALKVAFGTGHLVQGLELMEKHMDREAKGIHAIQEKSGQPPSNRLSRLVLLANDGSERFYRDAAALLHKHNDRAWGCLIAASSVELGRAFTAKGGPAKALMINDKQALGLFLAALASRLGA